MAAKDFQGRISLHGAAERGQIGVVRVLLHACAQVVQERSTEYQSHDVSRPSDYQSRPESRPSAQVVQERLRSRRPLNQG